MGPRSDNRGYGPRRSWAGRPSSASMGPRSDNRGYVEDVVSLDAPWQELQWVRGPITAVMFTVLGLLRAICVASMGPRSDNRGYGFDFGLVCSDIVASMGPRSDTRPWASAGRRDSSPSYPPSHRPTG